MLSRGLDRWGFRRNIRVPPRAIKAGVWWFKVICDRLRLHVVFGEKHYRALQLFVAFSDFLDEVESPERYVEEILRTNLAITFY
jgi:hypothetical protein